ncbi:MAG TPA: PPOX class F420-dependent oxidoreductase [Pseudonocardiaceae bacterium]|jgi:pyridoxamine 5'-phosphate oxidase family protein|nr:PPOX class F420-dependent oxidoreductase [Pseudonocardiaceae bacterium]
MAFTTDELTYLANQRLGRLATSAPDGTLQVSPVGFSYNAKLGTIDIAGFRMSLSKKYRNVLDNGRVAFVVDDIVSTDPWRVRCLEIRGVGECVEPPAGSASTVGVDGALIRIHPRRVISFGLENADIEPHKLVANRRDVS